MVCNECELIELEILSEPDTPLELEVDFEGEVVSGSTGEEYQNGYNKGKTDGYNDGHEAGYTEGHKDGYDECKAEGDSYYDAFWDAYQMNGERVNYDAAFACNFNDKKASWNNNSFKPKYNMKPTTAQDMFFVYWVNSILEKSIKGDLVEILENLGVELDFSDCIKCWRVFCGSFFTRLGVMDFHSVTYNNMEFFCYMTLLETIDCYIPPQNILTGTNNIFKNCKSLKYLTLGGNLLQNTDLSWSPLILESAISVITHLENYAGTENEFVYQISFSETTWEYLDAEGDTASPNSNSWREYIMDLGWNS